MTAETAQIAGKMAEWKAWLNRYDIEGEDYTAEEALNRLLSFLEGRDVTVSAPVEGVRRISVKNDAGEELLVDYDCVAEEFTWCFGSYHSHAGLDRYSVWNMLWNLHGLLAGKSCTVFYALDGNWLLSCMYETSDLSTREGVKAAFLEDLDSVRAFAKECPETRNPLLHLPERDDWKKLQIRLSFFDSSRNRSETFTPEELRRE